MASKPLFPNQLYVDPDTITIARNFLDFNPAHDPERVSNAVAAGMHQIAHLVETTLSALEREEDTSFTQPVFEDEIQRGMHPVFSGYEAKFIAQAPLEHFFEAHIAYQNRRRGTRVFSANLEDISNGRESLLKDCTLYFHKPQDLSKRRVKGDVSGFPLQILPENVTEAHRKLWKLGQNGQVFKEGDACPESYLVGLMSGGLYQSLREINHFFPENMIPIFLSHSVLTKYEGSRNVKVGDTLRFQIQHLAREGMSRPLYTISAVASNPEGEIALTGDYKIMFVDPHKLTH